MSSQDHLRKISRDRGRGNVNTVFFPIFPFLEGNQLPQTKEIKNPTGDSV